MSDAIHAEWTKLRTLAGTGVLLVGTVVATVAATAAVALVTHQASRGGDPTRLALSGIDLGQIVVVVLAVVAISEEYGSGMIRTSLSAVPRRCVFLAAKAATVAGLTVGAGMLAVAASLLAGRLLLPGAGLGPAHGYALVSIGHGPTLRAAGGCVVYLVLIALLSLGVATAIRDTAVSIGAVLGLLFLPAIVAQAMADPLRRHIQQVAPMSAGLAIQATTNLRSLPVGPVTGLGVLGAWAAGALVVAGLLLRLRDA
jgi:ABC-2 type transport system permease protein